MTRFILIILALVMSLCLLASCGKAEEKSEDNTNVQTTESTEAATEKIEYYKSDVETFEIQTPYANLKYPSKWEDECIVEKNEGDSYTVTVSGIVDDESVKLFDIVFGTVPENGYLLGTMTSDGEEVTVSLVDYSQDFTDDYSAEEYPDLYAMAEDVNEIISGLVYDYDMILK